MMATQGYPRLPTVRRPTRRCIFILLVVVLGFLLLVVHGSAAHRIPPATLLSKPDGRKSSSHLSPVVKILRDGHSPYPNQYSSFSHGHRRRRRRLRLALIEFTLSLQLMSTPYLTDVALYHVEEAIKAVLRDGLTLPAGTKEQKVTDINVELFTVFQSSEIVYPSIKIDNRTLYDVQVSTDLILQYNIETNAGGSGIAGDGPGDHMATRVRTIIDQQSEEILRLLLLADETYFETVDTITLVPSNTTNEELYRENDDYDGYVVAGSSTNDNTQVHEPWWSNPIFVFTLVGVGAISLVFLLGVIVWYLGCFYRCYNCCKREATKTQQELPVKTDGRPASSSKPEAFSVTSSSEGGTTTDHSDSSKVYLPTKASEDVYTRPDISKEQPPNDKTVSLSSSSISSRIFMKKLSNKSSMQVQAVYSEDKICHPNMLNGLRSRRECAEDKLVSSIEQMKMCVPTSIDKKNHTHSSRRQIGTDKDRDRNEKNLTTPFTTNRTDIRSQIMDLKAKRKVLEDRIKQKYKILEDIIGNTVVPGGVSDHALAPTHQQAPKTLPTNIDVTTQPYHVRTSSRRRDVDSISTLTIPAGVDHGGVGVGVGFCRYKYEMEDDEDDEEEDVEFNVLSSDDEESSCFREKDSHAQYNKNGSVVGLRSVRSSKNPTRKESTSSSLRPRVNDEIRTVKNRRFQVHEASLPALDPSYLPFFRKAYY